MTGRPSLLSRAELIRGAIAFVAGAGAGGRLLGSGRANAAASAADPVLVVRDVGLAADSRVLASAAASRFNLLGLHWRGEGHVEFRTRDGDGWSPWQRAVEHELADPPEGAASGWRIGTPVWAGPSTAVAYRSVGAVSALRAHEIWSPMAAARRAPAVSAMPFLVPRATWGANEAIVRATPSYADRLRFAVVHHTAGRSPATPEESAAIVRGIQTYHVRSNGWNDIGYNFLVDGFGQVFEGRGGGTDRNVIGAHALGFNTGSVGVAVLGNFESGVPTLESQTALAQLLAWRLDLGHVDPLALVDAVSTSGETRTLRAISGHRDVGNTACPGANLYPLLDALAQQVAATGLPKLFDPSVEVSGRLVRFTARFSQDVAFTVSVRTTDGLDVAGTSGIGTAVDWTWDATAAPDGSYAWAIGAGPDVLPASGRIALGSSVALPPVEEAPPRPPRPTGLPRRIPAWAWELRAWHRAPKGRRGPRPGRAPRRLPRWYWSWYRWVNAVERWSREFGGR
jgi:hypothetical protein